MSGKMYEKRPEEDARYHDTWRLLKKYRDVTWSLELSIRQVKNQFRIDYDCSIEDFLESIYMAGADLGGTDIENHARCIERSYKMLTLLENSVNLLRTHHQSGEVYCGNRLSSRCPTLFYRKEFAQIPLLHDRVALHEQQPEYLPASGAAAAKP